MIILGAGLSGCLAGALNKDATIYESRPDATSHKAILRFRSEEISEAIGIPFKRITVYKTIWYKGNEVVASPGMMNLYSRKVTSSITQRSISNLETVTRWVSPDNLLDILKEQCKGRIIYDNVLSRNFIKDCQLTEESIISTVPLYVMAKMFDLTTGNMEHRFTPIYINQYLIKGCDVYQTIYYPDPDVNIYRASLSGDKLIIESTSDDKLDMSMIWKSFGLYDIENVQIVTNHLQQNGKIMPINESLRRKAIFDLTAKHGIYSLGRFATWRHILMDDVYKDILVIKKLINKDAYEHKLEDVK